MQRRSRRGPAAAAYESEPGDGLLRGCLSAARPNGLSSARKTAFFSLAVIGRRFLVGVASDAVSAAVVAATAGRREEERGAAGFAEAEIPSILSTSFKRLDLRLQALDLTVTGRRLPLR